jgi:hypothetical protein
MPGVAHGVVGRCTRKPIGDHAQEMVATMVRHDRAGGEHHLHLTVSEGERRGGGHGVDHNELGPPGRHRRDTA